MTIGPPPFFNKSICYFAAISAAPIAPENCASKEVSTGRPRCFDIRYPIILLSAGLPVSTTCQLFEMRRTIPADLEAIESRRPRARRNSYIFFCRRRSFHQVPCHKNESKGMLHRETGTPPAALISSHGVKVQYVPIIGMPFSFISFIWTGPIATSSFIISKIGSILCISYIHSKYM